MPDSSPTFRTSRLVQFRHTDAAGIIHFSAYFEFMEEAEHEFLRHVGLSVLAHDEQGPISWPRVSVQCEFQGVLKFEDVVDVDVTVDRLGSKSVTYGFAFSHEGRAVASGSMTSVCCRLLPHGPPQSIPIPQWFLEKLQRTETASE